MTFLDSNVFVYFADGRDSAAPWRSRSPAGYSSTIRFFSPPRKQTNAARF